MNREEIRRRYPRLIRALQWTAILSESEAIADIMHAKRHGTDKPPLTEAGAHFTGGGPFSYLLGIAWNCRHVALAAK